MSSGHGASRGSSTALLLGLGAAASIAGAALWWNCARGAVKDVDAVTVLEEERVEEESKEDEAADSANDNTAVASDTAASVFLPSSVTKALPSADAASVPSIDVIVTHLMDEKDEALVQQGFKELQQIINHKELRNVFAAAGGIAALHRVLMKWKSLPLRVFACKGLSSFAAQNEHQEDVLGRNALGLRLLAAFVAGRPLQPTLAKEALLVVLNLCTNDDLHARVIEEFSVSLLLECALHAEEGFDKAKEECDSVDLNELELVKLNALRVLVNLSTSREGRKLVSPAFIPLLDSVTAGGRMDYAALTRTLRILKNLSTDSEVMKTARLSTIAEWRSQFNALAQALSAAEGKESIAAERAECAALLKDIDVALQRFL